MPNDLFSSIKLTKAEQTDLLRVIRGRERVAKPAVAERAAALRTDFETQISRVYSFDDNAVWKAMAAAAKVTEEARAKVDLECQHLGTPEEFRPEIGQPVWYRRGENAMAERRAELRRLAYAQITEAEQRAKVHIERVSVEAQSKVLETGIGACKGAPGNAAVGGNADAGSAAGAGRAAAHRQPALLPLSLRVRARHRTGRVAHDAFSGRTSGLRTEE